jgi:hypothetical protein
MEDREEVLGIYLEPVTFVVNGSKVNWNPQAEEVDYLYGSRGSADVIAQSVRDFIFAMGPSGEIAATPEGPFFDATTKDLNTVVWALYTLYGTKDIKVIGEAPTMTDFGLDTASNYDKNDNPIVR